MSIPERCLFSLAIVYMLTTVALSALGESRLDLYVSLYILEFFVITLLHSPLNPLTQKVLNVFGYGLFAVFAAIVAVKVLEILLGLRLL
jgi:hypothetical protein